MRKTASLDMTRMAKDFKVVSEKDFERWVNTLDGRVHTETNRFITEFTKELQYIVSQIMYGMDLDNDEKFETITVTVYPQAKKYSPFNNKIEAARNGTLDRGIAVFGFKEFFTLDPIIDVGRASMPAKLITANSCVHLVSGSGCGFNVLFTDEKSALRPQKKGFRSGIYDKKDPMKRIVVVVDAYPSNDRLTRTMDGFKNALSANPSMKKTAEQMAINNNMNPADLGLSSEDDSLMDPSMDSLADSLI